MLEVRDIDTFYGRSQVLHGVSFLARKGEVLAVLGRNGTGKTSLLRCLMGLTDRTSGQIRLQGVDLLGKPSFERARAGIGYVPQGREILPNFSVRDNIMMGCFARRDGRREVPAMVTELFPYLAENADRRGGLLSGGQQQQLAIARALAADPTVLLLDEPTEGIQPNIVELIEQTIFRLNETLGLTILLVDQQIEFVRRIARRFIILEKGSVAAAGDIEEMTDDVVHRHLVI
ncbi:MAG TPA: urea ABC transporter ATP-binding subunit UrtE [Acetobacteraceae bacterium]|nr:urea ABC transporter ATP-binding subunit UrtE [Acetobacteraceae bacterium]